MEKHQSLIIILILTNLLFLITTCYLIISQGKLKRLATRLFAQNHPLGSEYRYTDNPDYELYRRIYKEYGTKHAEIVMLGDSITRNVDWHELLSRSDVINRGIGNDVTAGYLNRLDDIIGLRPKLCIIMGGYNDLEEGLNVSQIIKNYEILIERLTAVGIRPIIQSTLYVSSKKPGFRQMNRKIKELNSHLYQLSKDMGFSFVNLNAVLSNQNTLDENNTYDGVHLNRKGYAIWREVLLSVLSENNS